MKVDLHLHTTASDGRLSPGEMVRLAAERGLEVIAITDHDTIDGIAAALEAAISYPSLRVIPGVEVNTDIPHGEIHILGYFIDYESEELRRTLEGLRNSREVRAQRMVEKLAELGMPVSWPRVQEIAGGASIGRPHVAQAMLECGYISSLQEAFTKYIGREGPAYAEREGLSPQQAVELVAKAGGPPFLAHPAGIDDLEGLVLQLKGAGLVGLEVYYNGYAKGTIDRLLAVASKHSLITSGGSDFHGLEGGNETPPGGIDVPFSCVEQLIAVAEQRSRRLVT